MSRGYTGGEVRNAIFDMFVENGGECVTVKQIAEFTGRSPATIRKVLQDYSDGIDWTDTYIPVNSKSYANFQLREQKVPAFQPSRSYLAERIRLLINQRDHLKGVAV